MSIDETPDIPKYFAVKNDLKWTQGFLGDRSKNENAKKASEDYGIDGIPEILLINPEGKVIATHLQGNQIMSTVSQVLSKK